MMRPILFLDTETLGLDIEAPVWEVAAVRYHRGSFERYRTCVVHDEGDWLHTMLQRFVDDYLDRYDVHTAAEPKRVAARIKLMARDGAIVAGSNPYFDMVRLEKMAGAPMPWHYHPLDVPTLALGWLAGKGVHPAQPWKSDFISQACGVNADDFERHTAMGDVEWCYELFTQVMGEDS
jgi:hypothetical protein